MDMDAEQRLRRFRDENKVATKGPLSLVIQLTRIIRTKTFPLIADEFLTENKGQVAGLGGGNLKKILAEHGITKTLASEGGRTSRGNMGLMLKYIDFLNQWSADEPVDLVLCEKFWADQVNDYFRHQPFVLVADQSKTVAANFAELFAQAKKRQKQSPGTQYVGIMLQHLVGAKLKTIMPDEPIEIHGAFVADVPTNRSGDFIVCKTAIHCTTAPTQALLDKCRANISAGLIPVIITVFERVQTTLDLATDALLEGRVEVWDIQQFLATNIYEHSLFNSKLRNAKISDIIDQYNRIVEAVETDPSLHIEFVAK